ncbi:hypothetical protein OSB04_un000765 [Centaurea solstitialis]|uniref:C2 domain-containing protein n=1 Tax=Centaurea solstitialis TaxID=347529 RepID=A0AA38VRJ1_9ASTR|nr:hypothetical protein OSB04_un000765 [Centaurea solstitialis]
MENSEIEETEWKILEITLISAQGLKIPPSAMMRRMYTYALAWVDPTAKLRSHLDRVGGPNPTWNEKFIFRVSTAFISGDTSAVQFQIYAAGYITDYSIGAVRYLLSTSSVATGIPTFSALHIRRPSGNIHGVLNIAATVYDGSHFASLTGRTSAVCFRDLIGKGYRSSSGGDLFSERRFSRCLSRAGSKKSLQSSSEAESLDNLSVEESVDFSDESGTDSTTASSTPCATVTAVKDGNGVRSGSELVQVAGKKDGRSDGGGGLLCGLSLQRRSGPSDQNLYCVKD